MNRVRWLIHLYPAAWRRRYESEFIALLDAHPVTLADMLDITFGAWDARYLQPDTRQSQLSGGNAMTPNTMPLRTDRWRWLAGAGLLFVGFLWLIQAAAALAPAAMASSDLLNGAAVSWLLLPVMGLTGLHLLSHRTPPRSADQAAQWPRWTAPACIGLSILGVFVVWLQQTSHFQLDLRFTMAVYYLLMIAGAVALGSANLRAASRGVLPSGIAWMGVVCAASWIGVMMNMVIILFAPEMAQALTNLLYLNLFVSLVANSLWTLSMAFWLFAGDWLTRRTATARLA